MTLESEATGQDFVNWIEEQKEGFTSFVTDPDGSEGFVSKVGGAFSFHRIGEGQDPVEVMEVAKKLHDAMVQGNTDADYLQYLGKQAASLAKPKNGE